jgi:multidrug resistance efflux pump
VGDHVTQGQVIARIDRPDLVLRMQQARALVVELRGRHQQQQQFGATDVRLQGAALAQRREQLRAAIHAGRSTLAALNESVASDQEAFDQGLITKRELLATTEQRDLARAQLLHQVAQLGQALLDRFAFDLAEMQHRNALAAQLVTHRFHQVGLGHLVGAGR